MQMSAHAGGDRSVFDLDAILARNRDFAREHRGGLSPLPAAGLVVLTCPDPRVDPAAILGLEIGDALVLRFPAGRFSPSVVRTLLGLAVVNQRVLEEEGRAAPDTRYHLMIVHHTDCGITRLDRPGDRELLGHVLEVAPEAVPDLAVLDPRAAVAVDVEKAVALVQASGMTVSGHVYDVETGLLDTVVPVSGG
jgi:carbonic anhydrase